MDNATELLNESKKLNISCLLLGTSDSVNYIERVLKKYTPHKTSGHLSIYKDSISIPLEKYEFTYCKYLKNEPVYLFFDQENHNRQKVVMISEGKKLCSILENSFGMEYFVSNEKIEYLIAVNWYVIEGAGSAKKWLSLLG
jgi:hypothetical protein